MRRIYDQKLADFYSANPDLKPIKADKAKKPNMMTMQPLHQIQLPTQPEQDYYQQSLMPTAQAATQQQVMVYTSAGQDQVIILKRFYSESKKVNSRDPLREIDEKSER